LTLSQPKTPKPIVTKFEWRDYVVDAYHQKFALNPPRGFFAPHHRLNGSSSHCVNGDFSFLCVSQKFYPHRIKTPDPIETKFGTVDNVGE